MTRGRSMASGQSAPSGQFSENQRMARSKFPVVRSRPDAIRSSANPALKTMVETRERDKLRAVQYVSATVISWSRRLRIGDSIACFNTHVNVVKHANVRFNARLKCRL